MLKREDTPRTREIRLQVVKAISKGLNLKLGSDLWSMLIKPNLICEYLCVLSFKAFLESFYITLSINKTHDNVVEALFAPLETNKYI